MRKYYLSHCIIGSRAINVNIILNCMLVDDDNQACAYIISNEKFQCQWIYVLRVRKREYNMLRTLSTLYIYTYILYINIFI